MSDSLTQFRLKHLAFTQGLSQDQLDKLEQITTAVHWDPDTVIFNQGDCNPMLYVVEEGRVAIEVNVPDHQPQTLLTVGPGEMFGWSSLFYQRPKTAEAHTLEPTKALALDANRLRQLCDADPALGYAITRRVLQVVSERLKGTRKELIEALKSRP